MKPKNKGGRPEKRLTDEQIGVLEGLASVLSVEQIADYFGMAKSTFYEVMERQPEVIERYKRGKAKAIGRVAQGLLQKAIDGDTASAIFYLKTQARWRETSQIDHTSSDGSLRPVEIVIEAVSAKGKNPAT